MDGEKQNDIRGKVGDLDQVPQGFQFDKELAWQKLEDDLRPARRKKLSPWLYAASFVSIAFITAFLLNDRVSGVTNISPGLSISLPDIQQNQRSAVKTRKDQISYKQRAKVVQKKAAEIIRIDELPPE